MQQTNTSYFNLTMLSMEMPEDTFKPHISLERPENASKMKPSEARALFRSNDYTGFTSGFCEDYTQFNVLVISSEYADDFEVFCSCNSGAFPVLYRSKPGEVGAPPLAVDSNIRTDLPCYTVWKNGVRVAEVPDLRRFESIWHNFVTFYIGCSSTFDSALLNNGIEIPNVLDIPGYQSNIVCSSVGPFQDVKMSVSMRTIAKHQLEKAVTISRQYPDYHGAPIHIGDPTRIGISGVRVPDKYVPTFWACGMTVNDAIAAAKPALAFSHFPGAMFVADKKHAPETINDAMKIVNLNKAGCEYFASIINERSLSVFDDILRILEITKVESDSFIKASLILSHADQVVLVYTPTACCQETDNVLGIVVLCQALLTLQKGVILVVHNRDKNLFDGVSDWLLTIGDVFRVLPVTTVDQFVIPSADCVLAITNSDFTHSLFETVPKNRHLNIVTLDSTGNPNCKVVPGSDCTIQIESVSTSAYALAGGLYVASASSDHWRYKNYAINTNKPPQFSVKDFISTKDQVQSLWKTFDVPSEQERKWNVDLPNLDHLTKLYTMLASL